MVVEVMTIGRAVVVGEGAEVIVGVNDGIVEDKECRG